MSRRPRTKWVTILSLSIFIALVIALVVLIPQLVSIAVSSSAPTSAITRLDALAADGSTPSPALIQARLVLARVRDEIIPREGQATQYDVAFNEAGYQTLTKWNENLKVEDRYAAGFESLNLVLPCCEWSTPSRDESKNCTCGHHQALEGLAKKLLSDGWDSKTAQRQVTLWTRYLFPKEAVLAEMEQRAQLDSEMKAALEELKARGEC